MTDAVLVDALQEECARKHCDVEVQEEVVEILLSGTDDDVDDPKMESLVVDTIQIEEMEDSQEELVMMAVTGTVSMEVIVVDKNTQSSLLAEVVDHPVVVVLVASVVARWCSSDLASLRMVQVLDLQIVNLLSRQFEKAFLQQFSRMQC